jgi:hypothetical protein
MAGRRTFLAPAVDADGAAEVGQVLGESTTEAAPRPCDQGDLAGESVCHGCCQGAGGAARRQCRSLGLRPRSQGLRSAACERGHAERILSDTADACQTQECVRLSMYLMGQVAAYKTCMPPGCLHVIT